MDDLAEKKLLDAERPSEEILVKAFGLEADPKRRAAMEKKLFRLDDELERLRVLDKGSTDHDDLDQVGPIAGAAERLRQQGARS